MEDPQRSVIGEEEHHEKKSMMKKVKDRAVKIKDTLKKRGYGRDHVNEEENDEHEEEEEEDDDDDGVQDPEAHGDAVFESTAAHTLEGQGGHPGRPGVHLGNTQPPQEHSKKSGPSEASSANYEAKTTDPSSTVFESTTAHTLEGQGEHPGRSGVHLGNTQPYQEDSNKSGASEASSANYEAKTTDPSSTVFESTTAHTLEGQGGHPGRSGVHLGNTQPHQEDSNKSGASEASPADYEAKTTEPSFTGGGEAHLSPITHSFQKMKISEEPKRITAQTSEGQSEHFGRSGVHSGNPQPLQEDSNQLGAGVASPTNYEAKTTDPSSTGGEEAHVSPVNRSFQEMMVSEEPEKTNAQTLEGEGGLGRSGVHSGNPQPLQENPNQPGAGVDSPVNYQAKTTDPSFTGGGEAHVSPNSSQEMMVSEEPEKTEDTPREIHDQFSPTTPPSEPTPTQAKPEPTPNHPQSYTEKITSTATAITGKATAAASTVYEAVAGKTTQGLGEKGVSVKEYFVGKLSPGKEDKALSEIISEAMHRKKEGEPLVGTEGAVETENGVVRKEEGVVGKMKGAVTSLFKKGENGAVSSPPEVQQGQGEIHHEDTKGRKLQESGN